MRLLADDMVDLYAKTKFTPNLTPIGLVRCEGTTLFFESERSEMARKLYGETVL